MCMATSIDSRSNYKLLKVEELILARDVIDGAGSPPSRSIDEGHLDLRLASSQSTIKFKDRSNIGLVGRIAFLALIIVFGINMHMRMTSVRNETGLLQKNVREVLKEIEQRKISRQTRLRGRDCAYEYDGLDH
mmetsp:Transcript_6185/g.9126  ORF Transcript_6185/g.9126 Transcript_6185/m.9126 type:complete len:133 (+) Transcript_6185:49-447(+)|eukprot:CAMPEP_0197242014 /NCGR_PEP_ID=MMETSP1429-20130617/7877_1 /TAXON_ID=49237 /ORGANISM="Chaetoceros  sp., Strain UNC1202" /LENGTH=132 /DNA_ID=CAMNT_0042701943 /DNA_START=28 /DNA_END=426 /DNA_ORIENTATION=-